MPFVPICNQGGAIASHRISSCCIILCRILSRRVMSSRAVSRGGVSCHVSSRVASGRVGWTCHVSLFRLCHLLSHRAILCHVFAVSPLTTSYRKILVKRAIVTFPAHATFRFIQFTRAPRKPTPLIRTQLTLIPLTFTPLTCPILFFICLFS